MVSFVGRILNNFENIFCYNLRKFIGRHEKTTQVIFLFIYVLLQLVLIYLFPKTLVTLIVILFLFFLSLERIFLYIRLEEERERFDRKESQIKERIWELRNFYIKKRVEMMQMIDKNLNKKR